MDSQTLYKANKLENERIRFNSLSNCAYNGHMYLKVLLKEEDVTTDIDREVQNKIQELLETMFREKAKKVEEKLEKL